MSTNPEQVAGFGATPSLGASLDERQRAPQPADLRYADRSRLEVPPGQGGAVGSGGGSGSGIVPSASDETLWQQVKKTAAAGGGTAVIDIPGFSGAATCMVAFAVKRGSTFKTNGPAQALYIGSGTPTLPSSGGQVYPGGTAGDQTQVALVLSISGSNLRLTFTNSHGSNAATVIVNFTRGRAF